MKIGRNAPGFTLIEVVIASAILAILVSPVLAGFIQTGRNFSYAADSYAADLLAENLLIDTETALSELGYPDASSMFANLDGYNDDQFDYIVTVLDESGGAGRSKSEHQDLELLAHATGEWIYMSAQGLVSSGGAVVTGNSFMPAGGDTPAVDGLVITYDNGYSIMNGPGGDAFFNGNECRIVFDENGRAFLNIVACSREIRVVLVNNYESACYLYINKRTGIPDSFVSLDYKHNPGGIITVLSDDEQANIASYVITVEIFDKQGSLLKKAADRILA